MDSGKRREDSSPRLKDLDPEYSRIKGMGKVGPRPAHKEHFNLDEILKSPGLMV
jgi:hypothetical protein